MGSFDILMDISEHFTLLQLMDYLGDVNHDSSVVGCWIFDSNYEKALVLNRESFDPSFGEKQVAAYETGFGSVRYTRLIAHPK